MKMESDMENDNDEVLGVVDQELSYYNEIGIPGIVTNTDSCKSVNNSLVERQNHNKQKHFSIPKCKIASSNVNEIASLCLSYKLRSNSVNDQFSPPVSVANDFHAIEDTDINGIKDLLCHFESYFHRKVDTELNAFSDFLHGMLSEQQIHLYQILGIDSNIESSSSACEEKCDILKKDLDSIQFEPECLIEKSHASYQVDDVQMPEPAFCQVLSPSSIYASSFNFQTTSPFSGSVVSGNIVQILELMSLSCEVTALLSQSKYLVL